MLELLTMESPGLAGGSLNPRHPWNDAESQRQADRSQLLRDRRAYYAEQQGKQQSLGVGAPGDEPPEGAEQDRQADGADHMSLPLADCDAAD